MIYLSYGCEDMKKEKIKDEIEYVKCPKCGSKNVKGSKVCGKCHKTLEVTTKSCPKCAKRNKLDATRCVSCGYSFDKKSHSTLINLIITILFIGVLIILVKLNPDLNKKHISFLIYAIGGIGILFVLISTFTYGKKEKISLSAEDEMNKKTFQNHITFSKVLTWIGLVVLLVLIGYVSYTLIKH